MVIKLKALKKPSQPKAPRVPERLRPNNAMMIWSKAVAQLECDQTLMLVIVVESEGSAPGKTGFKMLVHSSGRITGTIGGGIMEASIIKRCQNLIQAGELQHQLVPQVHHRGAPQAHQSGMICAGRQTLLLQPLSKRDLPILEAVSRAENQQKPHSIFIDGTGLHLKQQRNVNTPQFVQQASHWSYEEPLGMPNTLYIVGGGHVGLAISRIFSHLNFRLVIFDHRCELDLLENNPFVHQKIIGSYRAIGQHIAGGPHSYVAIVSAAYTSDVDALESVLKESVRYVGLMGSKAKIRRIFADLEARGVSRSILEEIHAPLGIPIGNRTPDEIAISLAAEIIRIKNAS